MEESLKALERLHSDIISLNEIEEDEENIKKDYNIIKKDLERLEKLEEDNKKLKEKVNHLKNVKNRWVRNYKFVDKENEKLKQALDIIKTKKVDIDMFIDSTSAEDYNNRLEYYTYINPEVRPLTQEEYELLKEVLGNE